ncbi:MAG: TetR family transcriptional regulator [Austwickia sp.]|nr:TetR family transcriptional regulator [Austwickia sp.]
MSEALSLRTVARCAGTSTNAIYTMFGGRDGLVHAGPPGRGRRVSRRRSSRRSSARDRAVCDPKAPTCSTSGAT